MQKTVFIVYLHCNHKHYFVAVRGDITQAPINVATKVRQRVTLPCAFDGNSVGQWAVYVIRTKKKIENPITRDGIVEKFTERFSLNTEGGQFALVIKSPVLSDGRGYICKNIYNSFNQHGDADVIVFGKTYIFQFVTNFIKL